MITILMGVRGYLIVIWTCNFPDDQWHWVPFHVPFGCLSSLGKCLSDPLPIFNRIFFVVTKLCEFVIYFVYKHLIRYVICRYFSPIQYVAFAFCWWFSLPWRIWPSPTWFMFVVVLLLLLFLLLLLVSDSKNPHQDSGQGA